MRSLESSEKELAKLRAKHTEQFKAEKWDEMHATGRKLIALLDTIVKHFPKWREK